MADERFLVVRLGSLGDIVHALPAVAALRESFPGARIDWVVEAKWRPLVARNPDVNHLVTLDHISWGSLRVCVAQLRATRYTCVLDFQGLYKSALLAWFSGAPQRIGWERRFARESGAAIFYTRRVAPSAAHVVEQNLELAGSIGARKAAVRFRLEVPAEVQSHVDGLLAAKGLGEFFVLSPGGGWRSKCWPPEQYGQLHRRVAERYGLRGVVSYGPGEEKVAEACREAAGEPPLVVLPLDLAQLMAALRRAKFFLGGDTGPLHLAAALGTPVIGLYGPTDPARNGPYSARAVVVRNASPRDTTYKRSDWYSPAMLSITVEQVLEAVEGCLRRQ